MRTRKIAWVVMCAMALSADAWADWTVPSTGSVSGVPSDVVSGGPGSASLTTGSGAYEIQSGTTIGLSLSASGLAGSWLSGGCVYAMDNAGQIAKNCGTGVVLAYVTNLPATVRARVTASNRGWACSRDSSMLNTVFTKDQWGFTSDWTVSSAWQKLSGAQLPGKCTGPIDALTVGADEYALFAFQDTTTPGVTQNLALLRGGALDSAAGTLPGSNSPPESVELTGYPGGPLRAFAVEPSTGELKISELDGGFGPFATVTPPTGVSKFRSVSLYQSATERFGMAVGELPDGGTTILSAVPDPDPRAFGTQWRVSTNPPTGMTGAPRMVDCSGANACAVASDGNGLTSVATYVNAGLPTVSSNGALFIPEGGAVTASVSASDPDGDALHLTWTAPSGGYTVSPTDGGTAAILTAPILGGVCDGGVPVQFDVSASDGMAGHLANGTVQVTVTRNSPPLTPLVQGSPLMLRAGGDAGTALAVRNPDECIDFPFAWTSTSSAYGIQVMGASDGTVTVTPPAHLCIAGGVTESFEVIAQSPYGDSDAGVLTVHVDPWGPPEPPFPSGASASQDAGTTVTYAPQQTHVCDDGGFTVPLTSRWTLDGGTVPPGVTLTPDLVTQSSGLGGTLTVASSDRCGSGTLTVFARNESTSGTEFSAWAPLSITLTPDWDPVDQAKLQITQSGASLQGELSVSGINCAEDRGLQADMVLERGGAEISRSDAGVPGSWALTPPASCSEQTFTVYAELPGVPSSRSNEITWTSPAGEPALGALDAGTWAARCVELEGEGARVVVDGSLHHEPGPASCAEQQVQWTQSSGPALTEPTLTGDDAQASAKATRWDEVVGKPIAFDVVARAGSKSSAPETVSAAIAPAELPVTARIEANPPIASETGVVGLIAHLHNQTGCPIENARWTFLLEGLVPQASGARVDGVLRPLSQVDGSGEITVEGVSVPPFGDTVVSFTARPALLGKPTARGVLTLGLDAPQPVSNEAGLGDSVETTGCGCGVGEGSGAAGLSFALAFLLVFARSKSNRRRRA